MGELFKTLGAWVGLLSGLFLLYDRYAKGRPVASLTVKYGETRNIACIRITNIGDYDIAVINATVRPEVYYLTEDLEVRTLLEGTTGQRPSFMLKPRQEKELMIASHSTNGIARAQSVTFCISWRRCNATWLPQMPVYVRTSTTIIRKYALGGAPVYE